jgi:hypothetical protein
MPVTWDIKPLGKQWTSGTESGKRTGTIVYQAIASEPSTPAAAEAACAAAPSDGVGLTIGSLYPGEIAGSSFKCVDRNAAAGDDTRHVWIVTASYDSSRTIDENPLAMPIEVEYDPQDSSETYFKDRSGTPKYAITTAGEPFGELPTRDAGKLAFTVKKNVAHTVNYATYESFSDLDGLKINSAIVTIDGRNYAVGTLKAKPPRLSAIKEMNGIKYRELVTRFEAKADGWNQVFESRGLYEKVFTKPTRIVGEDGTPVDMPWPLDASGIAQATAATPGALITLTPYASAAFTALI